MNLQKYSVKLRYILLLVFTIQLHLFAQIEKISDYLTESAQAKLEHHLQYALFTHNQFSNSNKTPIQSNIYKEKLRSLKNQIILDNIDNEPMVEVIIKTTSRNLLNSEYLSKNSMVQKSDGYDFVVTKVKLKDLSQMINNKNVLGIEPSYTLYPLLNSSITEIKADSVWWGNLTIDDEYITGEGVYVGIIDSKPLTSHETFMDENGNSRILDTYNYLPFLTSDHGTHVGGIAAGNGSYDSDSGKYKNRGVAFKSELLFGGYSLVDVETSGSSNLFLNTFNKMINRAASDGKALVVNASVGTQPHPHDGSTFFEQILDQKIVDNNVTLVIAAGNEGGDYGIYNHNKIELENTQVFEIVIAVLAGGNFDDSEFELELWYDSNTELDIRVLNKDNNSVWSPWVTPGSFLTFSLDNQFRKVDIFNDNSATFTTTGDDNVLFLKYYNSFGNKMNAGIYKIEIRINNGSYCKVDGYTSYYGVIDDERVAMVGWYTNPDKFQSLSIPGSTPNAICVGAFDEDDGDIATFSSKGPLRNDLIDVVSKPDITAPGVNIWSSTKNGSYDDASGTSMAAPHVTGSIALLLQYFPDLTPIEIKDILKNSARAIPPDDHSINNRDGYGDLTYSEKTEWGAGKLDILAAYKSMIGYKYNSTFMYKDKFEAAFDHEYLKGLPLEVVQEDWESEGLYKQRLTKGAIFYDFEKSDASWLGEEIWNGWIESESINSIYGLPLSSEYLDESNSDYKTVNFEYGRIWYDELAGELFYELDKIIQFSNIYFNKTSFEPDEQAIIYIELKDSQTGFELLGASVEFILEGNNYTCTEISNGLYQKSFSAPSTIGSHTINISANKNNYSTAVTSKQITVVDSQLPSISITSVILDESSYQPERLAILNVALSEAILNANVSFQVGNFGTIYECEDLGDGNYKETFRVPSNAETYPIQINASKSGYSPGTSQVNLIVDSPISVPTLIYPVDNEEDVSLRPRFEWQSVSGSEGYDLFVYNYKNGVRQTIYFLNNHNDTNFKLASGIIDYDEVYSWTVRVRMNGTYGKWAIVNDFNTLKYLSTPLPILPENESVNQSLRPILEWQGVPNADEYEVIITSDSLLQNEVYRDNVYDNYYHVPPNLFQIGTKYYWAIRAWLNDDDYSYISIPFSLTTGGDIPPGAPVLVDPLNSSSDISLSPTLIWEPGEGVSYNYSIEISEDFGFNSIVNTATDLENTIYVIPYGIVQISSQYFWRVKAENDEGYGEYSQPFSFTTTSVPPDYGTVLWNSVFPGTIWGLPVFDNEGYLYVGDSNQDLFKVDPANGDTLWRKIGLAHFTNLTNTQGPTVSHDGKTIYTVGYKTAEELPDNVTNSKYICALDKNGSVVWYYNVHSFNVSKIALDAIGNIYAVTNDIDDSQEDNDAIISFTEAGEERWRILIEGRNEFITHPIVSGNLIYLARKEIDNVGQMLALNSSNGSTSWTFDMTDNKMGNEIPAISDNSLIFNGYSKINYRNPLFQISKSSGSQISGWPFLADDDFRTTPVVGEGNIIYAGHEVDPDLGFGKLFALFPNGSIKWEKTIYDDYELASVLGDDGLLYYALDETQTIFSVDKENGNQEWQLNIGSRPLNIMMGPNGNLYACTRDNSIVAIKTSSSGLADTPWPSKWKDYQGTVCFDSEDILYPPYNIIATKGKFSNKVIVHWENSSSYDSVVVYRSENIDSNYLAIKTTSLQYVIDENIEVSTQYYYKVKSFLNSDSSISAPFIGIVGYAQWNEPHHSEATQGTYTDKIILKWSPPANETLSYTVSRSANKDSGYVIIKSEIVDTFYINSTVTQGVFWYKIKADYQDSSSGWSIPISGWKENLYTHYFNFPNQSEPYSIVIQSISLNGEPLETGDEIGVYDLGEGGIGLVGASRYDSLVIPTVITSYVQTTIGNDTLYGAIPDNEIILKIWDSSEEVEYTTRANFGAGGHFGEGFAANVISLAASNIILNTKVFLQGPFENSLMLTTLNSSGLIPNNQPYNISPWNFVGFESIDTIDNANIVDWVLIELRDSDNQATSILMQEALLRNDGRIVSVNGISDLILWGISSKDYYIVIYHRNHLPIMSSTPVSLSSSSSLYDFTDSASKTYGNGCVELAPGLFGMYSGDANGNGQVQNNDSESYWSIQNGQSGYKSGDFNLNGQVQNNDRETYWVPNNGVGSQVPVAADKTLIGKPIKPNQIIESSEVK